MKNKDKYIFGTLLSSIALYEIAYHNAIVKRYSFRTDKINDDIKIVVLSDLHNTMYGKNQIKLIQRVKSQSPDIIIYAGDMVDEELQFKPLDKFLKGLQDYPSYYIIGNHEVSSGTIPQVKSLLDKYSVKLLNNKTKTIKIKNTNINISGINDVYAFGKFDEDKHLNKVNRLYRKEEFFDKLSKLNKKLNNDYYSILISHRPCFVEYFKDLNYDMIISGHTHGGQWRIPMMLNGLFTPEEAFFPKYAGGVYEINRDKFLVIGRGLVKNKIPRFFNPPEIVLIELNKQN